MLQGQLSGDPRSLFPSVTVILSYRLLLFKLVYTYNSKLIHAKYNEHLQKAWPCFSYCFIIDEALSHTLFYLHTLTILLLSARQALLSPLLQTSKRQCLTFNWVDKLIQLQSKYFNSGLLLPNLDSFHEQCPRNQVKYIFLLCPAF